MDHFDPALFGTRPTWRVIGPASVVGRLPADRVLPGDSVQVGAFAVVVVPTPHTPDHRSYRIRWRGRVLHFTGDTESPVLPAAPRIDVLFVTPWLRCALEAGGRAPVWDRAVLYHLRPDGSDRICGVSESLPQGTRFTVPSSG
ncbi:MAG: hypothetical protein AB7L66_05170 [Gemmatimonadales bacterium]